MAVRMIIGRAGAGKTRRCFRAIVDACRAEPLGPPIYWILPQQATFTAERELTCASGLGGFCRVRVVSFEQSGEDLIAECGGAAVPEVTRLGRQMILGHLLRRHEKELVFFQKVARHPGLATKLAATLDEMESCGKDPADLDKLAADLGTGGIDVDPLAAKLHDLRLIYRAYHDYLGQDRLDPRRRMAHILQCIAKSRRFAKATVYVDGFYEFDDYQRRVLAQLAQTCREMEITLPMDPGSPVLRGADRPAGALSLFHRIEETYRRLVRFFRDQGVAMDRPVLLKQPQRFANAALAEVESGMFNTRPGQRDVLAWGIELAEAPDRRAEVEHAARRIGELLASGLRLRDIAVLVRRLDDYHDLFTAAFGEHGIRYFADRRRSMEHHPLLQFVRAVLMIVRDRWPHDAVMGLIKSGLAGLSADEGDKLENYVLEHRLRGSVWTQAVAWNWCRKLTRSAGEEPAAQRDISAEMDVLRRRLADAVAPFAAVVGDGKTALPLRTVVVELFGLFERFGLRTMLGAWIDEARERDEHEQAGEHEQAWTELSKLLDQMVELLGAEAVTLEDFQTILEAGLETFDLAIAPPTVDEVLVGQIDRTRLPEVKAALILGLNDGVFPYSPREGAILSDAEREQLQRHAFDVGAGTQRQLLDERFLGYVAFTRASQKLFVSRVLADGKGRAMEASPFWHRLRELFPALPLTVLPRDQRGDPALIGTPRQLLTALMTWARVGWDSSHRSSGDASGEDERCAEAHPTGTFPALYNWLAQREPENDLVDLLRFRAWKALCYENAAMLAPVTAGLLFAEPLRASAGQLEAFATCPFKHFLHFALQLRPRDEADVDLLNLDHVFHDILENMVRRMLQEQQEWSSLSGDDADALVDRWADYIRRTLEGEIMLGAGRNRYLLGRIERSLRQVIEAQKAVMNRGVFRTAFSKLDFGWDKCRLPPLVVPTAKGRELQLRGRIDRVDVLDDDGAFAILDYRLKGGELKLGYVHHGLALQLLTSLLALRSHAQALAGKPLAPAAAFYVRLLRQLEPVDHPSEALEPEDPRFPLRGKQRGIFDGSFGQSLDRQWPGGDSDVLQAYIKQDGSYGKKRTTDVAGGDELAALLDRVRQILAELGDQIMDGQIDVRPYRINRETPCSLCSYKSVCRFDPSINRYRQIQSLDRESVLQQALAGVSDER